MKEKHILEKPLIRSSLALLCCFLWGSAFPCVKLGYEWLQIENVGSQILFAGYRFFLAGVITFCAACFLEKHMITIKKGSIVHVLELGLLNTTIQYICFYIGMSHVSGTKGSIINAGNAFVSILLAHFLFKDEKMTWRKGIGCLIGFAGVIVINLEGVSGGVSFMGEGMVVLSTIAYGTCTVIVKPIMRNNSPMTVTAYQLIFGSTLLIAAGFASGGHIVHFDTKSILLLLYMAVLSSVAFSLWTALLKKNEAGKIAIFGVSIPIFGTLLSSLLLGETIFTIKNLVAFLCVCSGIMIVNRPKTQTISK